MNRDEMPSALQPYFTKDGRLRQLPRKQAARLLVFLYLAEGFDASREYSEADVNRILGGHEVDHATLRRYLVDSAILRRQHGVYRLADPLPSAGGGQHG